MVTEEIVPNQDSFFTSLGRTKEKNKARLISTIIKDESNNKVLHVSTPTIEKNKHEATPKNYNVQTINLGPSTKKKETKDLKDFVDVVLKGLDKEVQAKERLQNQVEELQKYIQHLFKPLQTQDQASTSTPTNILSKDAINEVEKMKKSIQVTHQWINGVYQKGLILIEEILQLHENTSSFQDIVQ